MRGGVGAEGCRGLVGLTCGFSLFYAVCVVFYYSIWLYDVEGAASERFDTVLDVAISVVAGVLLVGAVSLRSPAIAEVPGRSRRLPGWVLVGYACLLTALACACAAVARQASAAVLPAAGLAGVGIGLVAPFFLVTLAGYVRRERVFACAMMFSAGMVLAVLLELLPSAATLAASAIVLACSLACLVCCAPDQASRGVPVALRSALARLAVPGICTLALSAVYGVMSSLAVGRASDPQVQMLVSQLGGIAAALVFLAFFTCRPQSHGSSLVNVVFGVLATGLLFLPFAPDAYATVLISLIAAGWKLVMLVLLFAATEACGGRGGVAGETCGATAVRPVGVAALAYALPRFGLLLGTLAAQLVGASGGGFVLTVGTVLVSLYLVLMVIWGVNVRGRRVPAGACIPRAGEVPEGADAPRANVGQVSEGALRFETLARERGLTAREAEVIRLVAQGRDTDYICEVCMLSKNTVKSYRKTAYAKLGIHSRQEAIDLVSGSGRQGRD